MTEIPQIRSVMTPSPRSIEAGASLMEAQAMMEEHDVRHLPVTDNGSLVGIISDRDIKLSLDPIVELPLLRKVGDVMTTEPYVVEPDELLDSVLLTLAERRIGCVLVAENGKLAGIFTTTDATRVHGEYLRAKRPPPDAEPE